MNREQAINYLFSSGFTDEQVGDVVRALTYEPTTKNDLGVDLISRADALDCVNWGYSFSDIYKKINELPSVTPQLSVPEVTALAEWTTKLTEANKSSYSQGYADGMKAQAEPKTGHWINIAVYFAGVHRDIDYVECSCCHYESLEEGNYCPNCGAKMEGGRQWE